MSRRTRMTTWFVLGIVSLSAAALAGCATDPQTAAAVATGGLLGLQFGAMALTGSTLEIQIDMYAPTPDQYPAMRLDHPFTVTRALDALRAGDDGDLLRRATAERIVGLSIRLQPVMDGLAFAADALSKSEMQLRPLGEPYTRVADTFADQASTAHAALEAWTVFMDDLKVNLDRLGRSDVLDTLTSDLLALRVRLSRAARFEGVTPEYIYFLKAALEATVLADAKLQGTPHPALLNLASKVNTAIGSVKDDPSATGAERIAVVLDALRGPLATLGPNRPTTDARLTDFGLWIDSATLITLPSKPAIIDALAPAQAGYSVVSGKSPLAAVARESEPPTECTGGAALVVIQLCSALGYRSITLELNRTTADVNLGPISNEVQQVLQAAARGLGTITDPANEQRWRLNASYAKSDGGPGNHNSIIYFENMGLPIVKNSTFDPTKFVVAQGTLFRHLFTGAVAALGVPLPTTAGSAGGADLQSSNVIATRARIVNAQKAAAAAREKIIDALKVSIDQQQKIKDGDWAGKKTDLVKAAQKALQDAAGQLEAVAGAN